jgi:NAD(P)-dependent dehydrogenase (short-subunit alcohol dehydrogenase family)
MARAGADIIAVDIDRQIDTVPYDTARAEDLQQTIAAVERLDRRIVARVADVRSSDALDAAVRTGLEAFGCIDVLGGQRGHLLAGPPVGDGRADLGRRTPGT